MLFIGFIHFLISLTNFGYVKFSFAGSHFSSFNMLFLNEINPVSIPQLLNIQSIIPLIPFIATILVFCITIYIFVVNRQLQKKLKNTQNELALSNEKIIDLTKKVTSAIETKRCFLANISHEIRTPLNGIFGLTTQLKNEKLSDYQSDLLIDIELLTQNLSSIVNDILDYTKLETGKLVLDDINFHLINELSPELTYYRKKSYEKGLSFTTNIDKEIPLFFQGDPNRLKQIVNNLVGNAVKFTIKGDVNFNCELVGELDGHCELKFSVSDTGCGIDVHQKQAIWQAFQQINESNKRDNGGVGIGLTISKKLVELMEGTIDFESTKQEGSKFWFTIVLQKGIAPNLLSHNFFNKILLVEDNLINQRVSLFSLRKLGFEVDLAENGQVAVEKFKENNYDLILMDIQMPVMDGITSAAAIRAIEIEEARTKKVHIVALTANSLNEDRENCMRAGINGYISKPFNLEKFPVVISPFNGTH